jgi:uncharacterized protein (TIGR00299 family) protein
MTRVAYFDCFSGISGDMVLGALLDAGASAETLERAVAALGLGGEVRLSIGRAARGHLSGVRVEVVAASGPVRTVPELLRVVRDARLPTSVRDRALDALTRLGRAESRLHGVPVEELHLHELGGADTLVDIVGAFWLLDELGVATVHCSPLPAERGRLRDLPLPAPAALEVLAGTGVVYEPVETDVELVTPTGAAMLATCARFTRPALRPERIGYGAGGRDRPGNLLRVWVGELVEPGPGADSVAVLETNLDDMAPNLVAALVEDLMADGALDVSVTPALMKKGRPGHLVAVMASPDDADRLARRLLVASTTLGVRVSDVRRVLADRRVVEVETEVGRARVKMKLVGGEIVDVAPEYEDCRRLARETGRELRDVVRIVAEAARR